MVNVNVPGSTAVDGSTADQTAHRPTVIKSQAYLFGAGFSFPVLRLPGHFQ
jgi:hypothetical protein